MAIGGSRESVCVRTIQWLGRVEIIEVPEHVYAYRGRIPCTGPRVCIYCGQFAPESEGLFSISSQRD